MKFSKQRKRKKISLRIDNDNDVIYNSFTNDVILNDDVIIDKLTNDVILNDSVETINEQKGRTKFKKLKQFQNGTQQIEKLESTPFNDPLLLQTSENITENLINFLKNVGDKKNKFIDIGSLTGVTNFFQNISNLLQSRNEAGKK